MNIYREIYISKLPVDVSGWRQELPPLLIGRSRWCPPSPPPPETQRFSATWRRKPTTCLTDLILDQNDIAHSNDVSMTASPCQKSAPIPRFELGSTVEIVMKNRNAGMDQNGQGNESKKTANLTPTPYGIDKTLPHFLFIYSVVVEQSWLRCLCIVQPFCSHLGMVCA